ncbi:hypothetical protein F3Y22_tig00117034pilonHSYRG00149 [Hibiscus syriacus]|uniref:Uncharacterized protein n=1 Tax=Hibiscus syriacus TaxID=106335 RepID=A0A6A2X930_HIBSY|nr:hypothetical protein F3Y22_tig00117034pilonHSYRG00149 [Hibiscus syriacus]
MAYGGHRFTSSSLVAIDGYQVQVISFCYNKGRRETKEGEASSRSNEAWLSSIHAKILSRTKKLDTSFLLSSDLHRTCMASLYLKSHGPMFEHVCSYLQTDTSLAIEANSCKNGILAALIKQQDACLHGSADRLREALFERAPGVNNWIQETVTNLEMKTGDACLLEPRSFVKSRERSSMIEEDFPMLITFDDDNDDGFSVDDSFPHYHCDNLEIRSETVDSETLSHMPLLLLGSIIEGKALRQLLLELTSIVRKPKFDDKDLPFKLKQIITPDLRLLRLLEAGLPSWALFLQSYPGFCHIYRPWMCPLARALYVLISIITVLIGFFDLYKNVPLLKAAASHLCGPLLDWIENWEMVTRIKYLGTMLFLQNFEKAMHWLWVVLRASREVIESLFSIISIVIGFVYSLLDDLMDVVLMPICKFRPVSHVWIVWEMLYAPIRLVLALASFVANMCAFTIDLVGDTWEFLSSMIEVASEAEATVHSAQEVSCGVHFGVTFYPRYSALSEVYYGFAAFFDACNRHRLSIYNHILGFIQRQPPRGVPSRVSYPGRNKSTDGNQYPVSNHMHDPRGVPFPYYGFGFCSQK